ncbi:hypothetical protein EYV94_28155 [Puteibacter caeruleilacunae]|nr:hypothetical protein EYV94_28155 [Puteibacter caeruleilacunae]
MKDYKEKSLNQLIGRWEMEVPREDYSSSIQLRTYKLYHKRIQDYELEDIRFMIIQKQGLKHLIPLALNHLKENLLIEADYYEGDVLSGVLSVDGTFWAKNLKLYSEFYQILLNNKEQLSSLDPRYESDRNLLKGCDHFLKIQITK